MGVGRVTGMLQIEIDVDAGSAPPEAYRRDQVADQRSRDAGQRARRSQSRQRDEAVSPLQESVGKQ
jgi:hypothetical protein